MEMPKLWTGNTPRQELIIAASIKMRTRDLDAHTAIESVVDGARPGTVGRAMADYYSSISQLALERLVRAVERKGE